jgi:hypothetical protein
VHRTRETGFAHRAPAIFCVSAGPVAIRVNGRPLSEDGAGVPQRPISSAIAAAPAAGEVSPRATPASASAVLRRTSGEPTKR